MIATAEPGTHDGSGLHRLVAVAGASSRVVGDRAGLRALISWCEQRGLSVDAMRAADHDEVDLDPATAAGLAAQLRRAGAALRSLPLPAVGWLDETGTLVGGIVGDGLEGPGGLRLLRQGPLVAFADGHLQAGDGVRVTSWQRAADGTRNQDGVALDIPAAEALSQLCPGTSGRIVTVPATSVLAGLLTSLRELAAAAASSAKPLRLAAEGSPD